MSTKTAKVRCVGLVVETRPDHVSQAEVTRIRRLGATKVQIGIQSLSDDVLRANRRGHDVAATRRAMRLLRGMGFKIHAHWMPNLHGSSLQRDAEDFRRLWDDPDFRPDELKIYPCSLIESAELMRYHRDGRWRPYDHGELVDLLVGCLAATPSYCRLTRVIRDIPGTDIVVGNKVTNLRQVAEEELSRRGLDCVDIRSREIGRQRLGAGAPLRLQTISYEASGGEERFLQYTSERGRLAGFLRLRLPAAAAPVPELEDAALLREVHVYGQLVGLGQGASGKAQHRGLGKALIEEAARQASEAGYRSLAVISSVGTRAYYRDLGFEGGELYQHLDLAGRAPGVDPEQESA